MAEEKKIIVDEDWKEQAERETKALQEALDQERQSSGSVTMPEASFTMLVTSLVTQAMISLGNLDNPTTKKREPHLDAARFHIDMLAMLEQKTRGNLTPEESNLLAGLLFDLRMRFVEKTQ